MSSNLAYARPTVRPAQRPAEAPARSVRPVPRRTEVAATRDQRRARPKAAYAIITVASLFLIFAAQLLLSIVVSQGAYQIESLQDQRKDLVRTQEALTENLELYGSSQNLAANAAHLGMVPSAYPLFLDLETGAVTSAPGSVDRVGCGGSCDLVANSLLTGVPLVGTTPASSATPATSTASTAPTAPASTPVVPATVDTLPAPVTH
jgi:hypothetical protein